MTNQVKRLIEVDLPIKRISANARREKNTLSALHIWWARRPLAACRAVICAALWPDPADPLCPQSFREAAEKEIRGFAKSAVRDKVVAGICDGESWKRYGEVAKLDRPMDLATVPPTRSRSEGTKKDGKLTDLEKLRGYLLDFIGDFAAAEAAENDAFLSVARHLTQAAHQALTGTHGLRPLVVDPFSGGGSIPFEALRVGAEAFASDLNPIAVLINKVVLEYAPRQGQELASKLRQWGCHLTSEARESCAAFYPPHEDGAIPLAYLWARTVRCEGPGCGVEIPVLRSLWIDRSRTTTYAYRLIPGTKKELRVEILKDPRQQDVGQGTSRRSSVTCPLCGYTNPRTRVETQANASGLGQRLMAVVVESLKAREYRLPTNLDFKAIERAASLCQDVERRNLAFDEELPYLRSIFNVHVYGMKRWRDLFSPRQFYYLSTLAASISAASLGQIGEAHETAVALRTLLGFVFDKVAMVSCNVTRWRNDTGRMEGAFSMMALPMVWDWAEWNPFNTSMYPFSNVVESIAEAVERICAPIDHVGTAEQNNATRLPLPDDSAALYFTDPPYYDYVPYANLSDFFYVWLRRLIGRDYPSYFSEKESPKAEEIVQLAERNPAYSHKTREFFESRIESAFSEGRRLTEPAGIGVIVFAHKSTSVWETLLSAVVRSGWVVTASWPIDTELATRFKAINTASLVSSVHLVCRPRENPDGSVRNGDIGDWRDVLAELPARIHEWLPRLANEGVVGADAIFACLGPALEIFSRYSRVEKASGEQVSLRDYLEQVWAAVAREALGMIFEGADTAGFEEDTRLTVMWLWTLRPGNGNGKADKVSEDEDSEEQSEIKNRKSKITRGYALEYDAARKIAQGLGVHLEKLSSVVEIQGDTARLLSVAERTKYLFGKDESQAPVSRRKKKDKQEKFDFAKEVEEAEAKEGGWGEKSAPRAGETVLDQLHQAMILFASGRGEAMKRFLVEEGIGRDGRFWRLAQALSALYPSGTDEKRWVDGILARKKGLGF